MQTEVKKQYFELIVLLNKNNKLINEKTSLQFYIQNNKCFASLIDGAKIQLCQKNINTLWAPTSFTKFFELELFLADFLQNKNLNDEINADIHEALFSKVSN